MNKQGEPGQREQGPTGPQSSVELEGRMSGKNWPMDPDWIGPLKKFNHGKLIQNECSVLKAAVD